MNKRRTLKTKVPVLDPMIAKFAVPATAALCLVLMAAALTPGMASGPLPAPSLSTLAHPLSGYNQSYTKTAGSTSNANVDLVGLTSAYTGGPSLDVVVKVAGSFQVTSPDYLYIVWFGGSSSSNATAEFIVSNNSTSGVYYGFNNGGGGFGAENFTVYGGGSSLNFTFPVSLVGPASSFSLAAYSEYVASGSYDISWIGAGYSGTGGGGGGGGGGCSGVICSSGPSASPSNNGWLLYVGIGAVIVVALVVGLALLLLRKRKNTPHLPRGTGPPPREPPGWDTTHPPLHPHPHPLRPGPSSRRLHRPPPDPEGRRGQARGGTIRRGRVGPTLRRKDAGIPLPRPPGMAPVYNGG